MQRLDNPANRSESLPDALVLGQWPTALAPMQDVTNLTYMQVVAECGPPDYYFTEYFRVHAHSRLDPEILRSITENPTDRPVFAQLIGENLADLRRTIRQLRIYPVAGIDLNMGCPAPKVYKKNVGGGLLRDPAAVDGILGVLREEIPSLFTVKMRIGFEDDRYFEALLDLIDKHAVDLLSLHVRTVRGGYRSKPNHDYARRAAERLACPVLVNGEVSSVEKAVQLVTETGVRGVMVGRAAIRNPWIFRQIRQCQAGEPVFRPVLKNVYGYVKDLYEAMCDPCIPEEKQVARMKKFLNFVGLGVDEEGQFLHRMRRARTRAELFGVCVKFMLEEGRGELPFPAEPYPSLLARPNAEGNRKVQAKTEPRPCAL